MLQSAKDFVDKCSSNNSAEMMVWMENSSKFLVVATPVAMLLSPSFVNAPVDLLMGVVVPVHTFIGMKNVIEDYLPGVQGAATRVLFVLCAFMAFGLLKINLCGPGMTETVKSLWRTTPKAITDKANAK
jgi:succinate dehydrogenase hydrophobic anchor subunit